MPYHHAINFPQHLQYSHMAHNGVLIIIQITIITKGSALASSSRRVYSEGGKAHKARYTDDTLLYDGSLAGKCSEEKCS